MQHHIMMSLSLNSDQGRRRVFKSGPAEENVEWRWPERGRPRVGEPPLIRGLGVSPEKILNL